MLRTHSSRRKSFASFRFGDNVKLIDLNLLLYAVNRDSVRHGAAKAWVEDTLSGTESVALPWVVVLGFLRLSTNARVFPRPLDVRDAVAIVDSWFAQPQVLPLNPGADHWRLVHDLLTESGAAGNLTTDAHLAALAIEHGAELCSTDSDFARFPQLRWSNPIGSLGAKTANQGGESTRFGGREASMTIHPP